jgi:hypothetical protein
MPLKDEPGGRDCMEKLHNLIQVGVYFKFQSKENSTKILAGPYQNILSALFRVQPNFGSPINK